MRRLNKARVALKHHGTRPSKSDIEAFRASTTNFFEENTQKVFDAEFSDVSLIELIQHGDAKANLKKAEGLLREDKVEDALDKVALAFTKIIDDYENRKKGRFGRSPFFFGESLTFLDSFSIGIGHSGDYWHFASKLAEYIDKVKESVESLQNVVKILSLGIDYRRYVRFRLLTPNVGRVLDGTYHIERVRRAKSVPTEEDVRFFINFVIESAITLQEFDFSLEQNE